LDCKIIPTNKQLNITSVQIGAKHEIFQKKTLVDSYKLKDREKNSI
jgi:hypothetical protein